MSGADHQISDMGSVLKRTQRKLSANTHLVCGDVFRQSVITDVLTLLFIHPRASGNLVVTSDRSAHLYSDKAETEGPSVPEGVCRPPTA